MQRCMGCMREFPDEFDVCPHCGYVVGTPAANKSHLEPGTVLQGRYTLGRVLGQGGFGITYIAWDNKIARAVAVKEYLPNGIASRVSGEKTVSCNSEKMQQFFIRGLEKTRRETMALSRFDALESVVRVYDCIEENGTAYIIMELLRGKTVKQILKAHGVMPFEACVRIMTPVLQTLDAMHEAGMIHRDVAPDNIFVCADGKVKLLDFGSARVVTGSDDKSRSVMLKHGYAPLEQYSSKNQQGAFTDVYAACATIFCMLTGSAPDPATDRAVDDDLPQKLDGVCTKAQKTVLLRGLSMRTEKRQQSAQELLADLQSALPPAPKPKKEKTVKQPKPIKEKPEGTPESKPSPMHSKRKIISAAVSLVLIAAIVTGIVVIHNRNNRQMQGVAIEFGSYPQSEVTDGSLITYLNEAADNWQSYGYYSGTGEDDGKMKALDYMWFCDISYNGEQYRGVKFTQYRPCITSCESSEHAREEDENGTIWISTNQDSNGYLANTTYWFRYDPLQWRMLDSEKGILLCESIIDSQPFNNFFLESNDDYWGDESQTYYANNYANSSIRQWLNQDFYNTAFTLSQKEQIAETKINNLSFDTGYSEFNSSPTIDKIYLLSWDDAQNTAYGFNRDSARTAIPTDYAKCQGIDIDDGYETSTWWLRSAGFISCYGCCVLDYGKMDEGCYVNFTDYGVRPALQLKMGSSSQTEAEPQTIITETEAETEVETARLQPVDLKQGGYVQFGSYPQTEVKDGDLIASLNALEADWQSYGYFSGTGSEDGKITASDYMQYCDVEYEGERYRGVSFTKYRPLRTGDIPTLDHSCQDNNGYTVGTTYWFQFKPLLWRVLDAETGLVLCEKIIDSQPFKNNIIKSGDEYYGEKDKAYYANNYTKASVRGWLNTVFYNTVFTEEEKEQITGTRLDNRAYSTEYARYNSESTADRIFLLSYADAQNPAYGFNSDKSAHNLARQAKGSDYAKCQGLWAQNADGFSTWRLRTAGDFSYSTCYVDCEGWIGGGSGVRYTNVGIRPAMRLNQQS